MKGVMLHEYAMLENGRPVLSIADDVDELTALSVVLTISYVTNATEVEKSTVHR